MPIANYSTTVSAEKTAQEIMGLLALYGATAILTDFDGGEITGLSWKVRTPQGELPFRLPVNVSGVQEALKRAWKNREGPTGRQTTLEHAKKVAWRILRDWIRAQMSIVEAQMASIDEVFLPYLMLGKETLYHQMLQGGFKQLASGRINVGKE